MQSEIEVWTAAAARDTPGELESRCQLWLTESECRRADRFRVATARNQHVVGRGMARRLLTRGSAVDPRSVVFEPAPHGKPYVVAPGEVARPFNVSHTDGLVLFAGGRCGEIGVDVERLSRRTDVMLAERYFATAEVEYVFDHRDPDRQRLAFLRVWTLKEALIKAIGTGLTLPLADFAFYDIDAERPRVRMLKPSLGDGDAWRFIAFAPADGYVAALALDVAAADTMPGDLKLGRFETWLGLSNDA